MHILDLGPCSVATSLITSHCVYISTQSAHLRPSFFPNAWLLRLHGLNWHGSPEWIHRGQTPKTFVPPPTSLVNSFMFSCPPPQHSHQKFPSIFTLPTHLCSNIPHWMLFEFVHGFHHSLHCGRLYFSLKTHTKKTYGCGSICGSNVYPLKKTCGFELFFA